MFNSDGSPKPEGWIIALMVMFGVFWALNSLFY